MFKTFKSLECTTFFFFQTFLSNVHHSSLKLKKILTLMIKGTKKIKIDDFFYNTFEYNGSNVILVSKIMNFEDVTLTKTIHFYVIKDMNAKYAS